MIMINGGRKWGYVLERPIQRASGVVLLKILCCRQHALMNIRPNVYV